MKLSKVTQKAPGIIFFILLGSLLVVLGVVYKQGKFSIPKIMQNGPSVAPSEVETNSITLPIPLTNRNISTVFLSYSFFGPIKEIKETTGGKQIILDTTEKNLPDFIVSDKSAKVFNVEKTGNLTEVKIDNLKEKQRVSISTTYEIKTQLWIARSVYITSQ